MADISKIILPDGSEYNYKDAYARKIHVPDAIATKTHTDVIGTANNNNGASFFYMSFRPAVYTDLWHIKVRVTATIPNNINYAEVSIFDFYGSSATVSGYACLNQIRSTSYRPFYYHSVFLYTQKGFNNDCSCYVGFNLANSTNPTNTSLKRTFKVELLYYDNCEVELLDSLITPTNIPNRAAHTDYYTSTDTSMSNFNAFSIGLKQSGDADTTTITTLSNGAGSYTIDSAVYRYQLLFEKDANTLTPLNNNNNTTGTTKTMLTEVEFDPFGRIYYYGTTTTLAAGAIGGAGSYLWANAGADLRYTFNITTTSFTAHQAVYLVVTPTSGGKCKIASALPVTQTLPNTADGNWYILLGRAYSGYQIGLWPVHPVYMHNGTSIQRVLPQTALANSTTAGLMTPAEKTKLAGLEGLPAVSASDNGKVLKVANGEWGAAASEVEIEDSLTSQSATKALSAKQGNVLAGKIMSKAWTPESGDTLLTYIINNVNKGDLPFSGIKVGSVTVSDTPYTTQEFTIFITGHTDRMDVCIREYGGNGGIEYHRAIWQNAWNGWWRRVDDLRADVSSVAIMNSGDTAQSSISSGEFVYIRNHGTLAEGLYRATGNIAANESLSASNVSSVTKGLGGLLSKAIIVETYTYNYSSLAVDGYKAISASEFGITDKPGYTLAGILEWKTGSYNVYPYGVAAVTSGAVLAMRNRGTGAVSTSVTASVTCLWVRDEFM